MKTYVMMTKICPQDAHLIEVTNKLKSHSKNARSWLEEIKEKCPEVKFLAHYALLGPYDFMDIYEAPDEKIAAKVSIISRSRGVFQVESWPAIPSAELAAVTEDI